MLWTLEMPPHQLRVARHPPAEVTAEHLDWVRGTFLGGALLLENKAFNRAFQTFDNAIWAHSASSAIIMAWAALETLFRPGRRQITKTLAICIATFLHPAGPDRDRTYQVIERLYETRGSAVHDARVPETEQLLSSFQFARRSLIKCLETSAMPDAEQLLKRWKKRE